MRRTLEASLTDRDLEPPFDRATRSPEVTDTDTLAALMLAAYRGTTDDSGETLADAIAEVTRLFGGAYGDFDFAASEVVERDGSLVAATLITRFEGAPFVAFSMTHPAWKRCGLARSGLMRAMNALRTAGETRLRLVVTSGNTPAELLYASLGFVELPPRPNGDSTA